MLDFLDEDLSLLLRVGTATDFLKIRKTHYKKNGFFEFQFRFYLKDNGL